MYEIQAESSYDTIFGQERTNATVEQGCGSVRQMLGRLFCCCVA